MSDELQALRAKAQQLAEVARQYRAEHDNRQEGNGPCGCTVCARLAQVLGEAPAEVNT